MEITFQYTKLSDTFYRITDALDVCMYYVQGKDRGLLIDTGYGLGDLKAFVDNTFEQDYDVLVTHGHADHAGGCSQWDTIFMSYKDVDVFHERTGVDVRYNLLKNRFPYIRKEDFLPQYKKEIKPLYEGMVFELGDESVEVIEAPGHTQGIVILLLQKARIAMFGDACGQYTFMFRPECTTIETYKNTLEKLLALQDKYDIIYRQHGSYVSSLTMVQENLRLAQRILDGTDDHQPFFYDGFEAYVASAIDPTSHQRYDKKEGNIIYGMDKIR